MLIFGAILIMPLNGLALLAILPLMVLITFGFVSLGLTIASFMENLESYGVIVSFVNLPLFFLSGALFPISGGHVPEWLQIASNFNPLTYGVDALRTIILGEAWQPLYPFYYDLLIVALFDVAMIIIGTLALNRRK